MTAAPATLTPTSPAEYGALEARALALADKISRGRAVIDRARACLARGVAPMVGGRAYPPARIPADEAKLAIWEAEIEDIERRCVEAWHTYLEKQPGHQFRFRRKTVTGGTDVSHTDIILSSRPVFNPPHGAEVWLPDDICCALRAASVVNPAAYADLGPGEFIAAFCRHCPVEKLKPEPERHSARRARRVREAEQGGQAVMAGLAILKRAESCPECGYMLDRAMGRCTKCHWGEPTGFGEL